jgi:hypothetical protein
MKNFTAYLMESEAENTYEFKIKLANVELTDEILDNIEHALKAFDLDKISKPKHLPVTAKNFDFPKFELCDIHILDATLKYPCTDQQIRQTLSSQGRIPLDRIVVVPKNSPEELLRDEAGDETTTTNKEALLTKELEKTESGQPLVGTQRLQSMLKDLESQKLEFAKTEKVDTKSTNDLPQNNKSPMVALKGKK